MKTVRTGLESAARLVMADSTNLSLGANASITLDRTVFDDEHKYRDHRGEDDVGRIPLRHRAFRKSRLQDLDAACDDRAWRGTILDILSERGKTTVVLQEGGSSVCTLSSQCIQLEQPGDTAIITSSANGPAQHDQEDQHAAMDVRRRLRVVGWTMQRHRSRQRRACAPATISGMLCGR